MACGWNHTLALTEGGGVTAWGCNAFGQLGMPSVDKMSAMPMILSPEVSVVKWQLIPLSTLYQTLSVVIPRVSCERY